MFNKEIKDVEASKQLFRNLQIAGDKSFEGVREASIKLHESIDVLLRAIVGSIPNYYGTFGKGLVDTLIQLVNRMKDFNSFLNNLTLVSIDYMKQGGSARDRTRIISTFVIDFMDQWDTTLELLKGMKT